MLGVGGKFDGLSLHRPRLFEDWPAVDRLLVLVVELTGDLRDLRSLAPSDPLSSAQRHSARVRG